MTCLIYVLNLIRSKFMQININKKYGIYEYSIISDDNIVHSGTTSDIDVILNKIRIENGVDTFPCGITSGKFTLSGKGFEIDADKTKVYIYDFKDTNNKHYIYKTSECLPYEFNKSYYFTYRIISQRTVSNSIITYIDSISENN